MRLIVAALALFVLGCGTSPPDWNAVYWVSCTSVQGESWWYVKQENLSEGIRAAVELCNFAIGPSPAVQYGSGKRGNRGNTVTTQLLASE